VKRLGLRDDPQKGASQKRRYIRSAKRSFAISNPHS